MVSPRSVPGRPRFLEFFQKFFALNDQSRLRPSPPPKAMRRFRLASSPIRVFGSRPPAQLYPTTRALHPPLVFFVTASPRFLAGRTPPLVTRAPSQSPFFRGRNTAARLPFFMTCSATFCRADQGPSSARDSEFLPLFLCNAWA